MIKFTFLVFVFFFSLVTEAQRKFEFDYDYSQFAYDSSSNYLELYYSFGQRSLSQSIKDSSLLLDGILDVEITDTLTHTRVVDNQWRITHEIRDTMSMNKSLVGMISFIIPEGNYICTVKGMTFNDSTVNRTYNDFIKVSPFIDSSIALSNIQLASNILQDSRNDSSIFYKNSYEIIPLPTSIYGENLPVVFYYLELYNLSSIENDHPLKLSTIVFNSRNNILFNKSKTINKTVDSRVEVGTVPVNKFPTDAYTLLVNLVDSIGNFGISSAKKFYVLNPSVEFVDSLHGGISDAFATQFGDLSEEELDELFSQAKYIAVDSEIDQYNALSGKESKQKYLNQFWDKRDTDPATPRNEFLVDYLNRVRLCNQQFATLGKKGWKTDRGRVFLKYGEPSEIERYPNQIDSRPYEIWYYNELEGGVIFVFADLTNFSDYQLIHSTARGELRDDNWQMRIRNI